MTTLRRYQSNNANYVAWVDESGNITEDRRYWMVSRLRAHATFAPDAPLAEHDRLVLLELLAAYERLIEGTTP